jgi:hypothetical protein
MHGQAENAPRRLFAAGKVAGLMPQVGKGALLMQGQGVVDRRGYAGCLQFS